MYEEVKYVDPVECNTPPWVTLLIIPHGLQGRVDCSTRRKETATSPRTNGSTLGSPSVRT